MGYILATALMGALAFLLRDEGTLASKSHSCPLALADGFLGGDWHFIVSHGVSAGSEREGFRTQPSFYGLEC